MKFLFHLGQYALLMQKVFSKPEKKRLYFRQLVVELESLGINCLGLW